MVHVGQLNDKLPASVFTITLGVYLQMFCSGRSLLMKLKHDSIAKHRIGTDMAMELIRKK